VESADLAQVAVGNHVSEIPLNERQMIESTGMAYYADKDVDLARFAGGFRTSAFRASYLERLRDPSRAPKLRELRAVLARCSRSPEANSTSRT
jgi:hypothetical protein